MFDIIIIAVYRCLKTRSLHVPSHCMTIIIALYSVGGGGGEAAIIMFSCRYYI